MSSGRLAVAAGGKNRELKLLKGERKTVVVLGGGGVTRVRLAGSGAEVTLLGMIVGRGKEELTMAVEVIHEKPKTKAEIVLKGVAYEEARVEIKGWVKINKGAKGAEDLLKEGVLLVGEKARGVSYPYLEIEENDVVAKHAATVGKLDEEVMFYLQSRGLRRPEAEKLLVRGFLAEIVERDNGKIRAQIERGFDGRLD